MNQTHTTGSVPRDEFLSGGEMGALVRRMDWSKTPLGPVEEWPQSLKVVLRIMLTSRYAMWMGWGPRLTFLYNDSYRPTLGVKHSWALGAPAEEVWAEIWDTIGPRAETVMRTGVATWDEALPLFLERSGFPEETYHTFSYSPLPDHSGAVGGMLCVVTEDTERVIGVRRVALLRDVASALGATQTQGDVLAAFQRCAVDSPHDIPFTLIYLSEGDGNSACLAGSTGVPEGHPIAPAALGPAGPPSPWFVPQIDARGGPVMIEDLARWCSSPPSGRWDRSPERAVVVPLAQQGQDRPAGLLVTGINPYRPFDADYRGFVSLLAGLIASGLANARAYEEERKRAEALAKLDRAKTAFFSNVSHEFRTPLTLMLGPAEDALAAADEPLPPRQRERVEILHRNALRLLKLVNTLLDFSRIEAGRIQAVYEPTDLAALTADLASVFRSAVERAGMRLVVDCPPLPEPVYVDRDMWEKIVLNLISNAFKYTLEGEIRLALRPLETAVELTVKDTGTGIPADELPRLFERFHRVAGTRGRTHEGTGIGLALVQELVKLHGGTVRAESVLGEGSSFTVSVPLGTSHLPPGAVGGSRSLGSTALGATPFVEEALRWLPEGTDREPPARLLETDRTGILRRGEAREAAGKARPRILLADDNADMRDYLRRLLAEQYDVEEVTDGASALAAVRRNAPDLVLTDVMMPLLDGFGVLRELRADPATAPLPVIMLSARAGEDARVEGLQAGADDYLVKPFSARELLARVAAHIELADVRRSAARREWELRAEAEAANRMKDDFLATLSHELRTPLNAIMGWSRLLRSGALGPEDLQEGLDVIDRNTKAQAQLIEDLLDLSRIVSGNLRLDVQRVNLAEVIDAALAAVAPAADAREVRIHKMLDSFAAAVSGDPVRLQQVVWNLLSNAVKFTPKGRKVQILLERVNSHVEIAVIDTGIGIKPEFLPYVFERFRQADPSTTRRHGGLGLELSIVKHLVEMHGGSVRAKSAGENQGSTFVIQLPIIVVQPSDGNHGRVLPKDPSDGEMECPPGLLGGIRVLVVDDEPDARELIRRVLAGCEADVFVAGSVPEALALLESHEPDVLVSDIGMPERDGYDLIREVRARGRDAKQVPAIALTAFARSEDRRRAMLAGFQVHVAKPVDPDELTAVVATLVGRTGGG
ncbi:MAG: ATP-binding protein [Isosphaeraceae bacterium]|nr:ATP-binding protein [Isosphaeraceae bacterium]